MSTNNETCQIAFPWDGVLPSADTICLRDIDVIGVGAKRRRQIEELQKIKRVILWTHEVQIPASVRVIYDEELLRTLQWLRPLKVESKRDLDLLREHQKMYSRLFPLTEKSLGLAAWKVRDSYLGEMEWSSWLLQDHWRYFVGFLRQRFPENHQTVDLAYWEWVHAWLDVQPFDMSFKPEAGLVALNPTLQIVPLVEDNATLGKAKGLYSFVYGARAQRVLGGRLDAADALLIDLLREDRKYTMEQLLEMAALDEQLPAQLTSPQWQSKFDFMLENEIFVLGSQPEDSSF